MIKTAYVLSGGGVKGAFQLGVMKKLQSIGIKPDVIYGTSVGSINAAGYAYAGLDGLETLWKGIEGKKWYKPWTPSSDILSFNWMMLLMSADGLYNLEPLRKQLNSFCKENSTPQCESVSVRVSLNTGAVDYVSNMKVSIQDYVSSVIGSSAIPGAMSPEGEWVDGGVREVVPIRRAIKDGAKKIYVIMCNPILENPAETVDVKKIGSFFKFFNVTYRAIDGVMTHEIFYNDVRDIALASKDVDIEVYAPTTTLYGTLEFDPKKIANAIKLGMDSDPVKLPNWVITG
jgi:NTE family protein